MGCSCHRHHGQRAANDVQAERDWRESTVVLVRHGDSATVQPAMLAAREKFGGLTVRLDELWAASRLPGDFRELLFDFMGEGGYRATSNGCSLLEGNLLVHGHLVLQTGRLEWDQEAELACKYRVKGLTMIVAYDEREPLRREPPLLERME